jgi:hypothetical protein
MPRRKTEGNGDVYGKVKEELIANSDFDTGANHCDDSKLQ